MNNDKELLNECLEAMKWFVHRVDIGEIRSRRTYAKFKEIIAKSEPNIETPKLEGMHKYLFGVMSGRYSIESDDEVAAKVAMKLYYHDFAGPIAIFKPIQTTLWIKNKEEFEDLVGMNMDDYLTQNNDKITKILKTLKPEDNYYE